MEPSFGAGNLSHVALFTEGVDWNWKSCYFFFFASGRPLHRGCGLKLFFFDFFWGGACRPLHRGCGLKSDWFVTTIFTVIVALFTEGVDWNFFFFFWWFFFSRSPSSQRVWIEIIGMSSSTSSLLVALFTEGVDWNKAKKRKEEEQIPRRPLHRGCGLKFGMIAQRAVLGKSRPLHRGCGLKCRPIISRRKR